MISANHRAVAQLLVILTECARKGEPRPRTCQLEAVLQCGRSTVSHAIQHLVKLGDIKVEGNSVRNRVFVKSVGRWTEWLDRERKGACAGEHFVASATMRRKCILSSCRHEFDALPGQWYCPDCRRSGVTDGGLPKQWEYA